MATNDHSTAALVANRISTRRTQWDAASLRLNEQLAADAAINARHEEAERQGTLTVGLEDEWDASGTRLGNAEWALLETPAPSLRELEWKLEALGRRGLVFDGDIAAFILTDVRRFVAEEARA